MTGRSVFGLLLLAFLGGAALVGWLASIEGLPWAAEKPAATMTTRNAPITVDPSAASPTSTVPALPTPTILANDAARVEAMVVAMAARRAIDAGAPLGPLAPRLNAAFAQTEPTALASINAAASAPLTTGALLAELDEIGPTLKQAPGTAWEIFRREISTMFVLRKSDAQPSAPDAQLARAKQLVSSGNVESAIRFVEAMPGAANGSNWISKARRYLATRRALDALDAAALALPVTPPAAPEPAGISPDASPYPASEAPPEPLPVTQ